MQTGRVPVIIPASIAVVFERPWSINILNKNTPNNACKKTATNSFLFNVENPSIFIHKGIKIIAATRNLSSLAKKIGKL
ncbi:hypothetical protein D9M71_805170 [compost metagenome]